MNTERTNDEKPEIDHTEMIENLIKTRQEQRQLFRERMHQAYFPDRPRINDK